MNSTQKVSIKILPAFNGDCIIISFPFQNETKNILIDGGTPKTYQRFLKPEINNIINKNQKIDLLIISHIDDDHIGGILQLFKDDSFDKKNIKDVWFNSGEIIRDSNDATDLNRGIRLISNDEENMSFNQANTLEKTLREFNIWNEIKISNETVLSEFYDASINILSPTQIQLENLNKKWLSHNLKEELMSGVGLADFSLTIEQLIELPFVEDDSVTNGSSIALILEIIGIRILLLADSHPNVVINELRKKGYSKQNKLVVDWVKVSHHGSKKNTNNELLELIDSKNYIICTDGEKHNLPNKESLARIIYTQPNCNFFFNYKNGITMNIFTKDEIDKHNFTINYLENLTEPYTIICD